MDAMEVEVEFIGGPLDGGFLPLDPIKIELEGVRKIKMYDYDRQLSHMYSIEVSEGESFYLKYQSTK